MQATATAQPNIALVKYWGKRDARRNLPAVGSISVTLDSLYTEMTIEVDASLGGDELLINGAAKVDSLLRVSQCLDSVAGESRARARVASTSNFPIAAGLASSASAFAALVVAASAAYDCDHDLTKLIRFAGCASGSAARSLFGGFVELSNRPSEIDVCCLRAGSEWPLSVIIAVTAPGPKAVSF